MVGAPEHRFKRSRLKHEKGSVAILQLLKCADAAGGGSFEAPLDSMLGSALQAETPLKMARLKAVARSGGLEQRRGEITTFLQC